ncbi:MAG: phage tail tip lysozyme, partial [Eubacteriales bacterium]|nr:phage tail tip lysozyme [Eubacteriales bacterium]
MINKRCRIGKKTQAARRLAGLLMTGTLTVSLAMTGTVSVAGATWQENCDYIFTYLTQRLKYNQAAACGILANIRCESTFNPHAWNAGGGSYGLCQWTGGRYSRLRNWCGSNGYDYTTIDGQLAYLEYELENFYPRVEEYLRSVENTSAGAYNAGQYYCYHFEAPASRGSVSVYRGNLASGTYWSSYRPAEWYQDVDNGPWRYILPDGTNQTEWLTIAKETFYLDEDGRRVSGWRSIDGDRYYFDDDGVMVTGWQKMDGRSYYFEEDGSLVTGMVHDGDDWYLLDNTGSIKAASDLQAFAPVWIASAQEREKAAAVEMAKEEAAPETTVASAVQELSSPGEAALNTTLSAEQETRHDSKDVPTVPAASDGQELAFSEERQETLSSIDFLKDAAARAARSPSETEDSGTQLADEEQKSAQDTPDIFASARQASAQEDLFASVFEMSIPEAAQDAAGSKENPQEEQASLKSGGTVGIKQAAAESGQSAQGEQAEAELEQSGQEKQTAAGFGLPEKEEQSVAKGQKPAQITQSSGSVNAPAEVENIMEEEEVSSAAKAVQAAPLTQYEEPEDAMDLQSELPAGVADLHTASLLNHENPGSMENSAASEEEPEDVSDEESEIEQENVSEDRESLPGPGSEEYINDEESKDSSSDIILEDFFEDYPGEPGPADAEYNEDFRTEESETTDEELIA